MTRVSRIACLTVWLCGACGTDHTAPDDTPTAASMMDEDAIAALRERAADSFSAIEAGQIPQTEHERALFDLGRKLFFETRLSADSQVACSSCHMTPYGGADGLALSLGVSNRKTPRNAPTVFNTSLQSSQQWRSDRSSLADQAAKAPLEMAWFANRDEGEAMDRLRDAGYQAAFEHTFAGSDPALSLANLGTAVEAFEQTLLTPSRFDAFLDGDDDALDSRERAGLNLFIDSGCAGCHKGPGLGGQQLTKFGALEPYTQTDQGRFDVTHDEADRFVYKVPMLRNVVETAPYFHDGSAIGLEQAVRVMLEVQVGKKVLDYDVENMVAFLTTLSGPAPEWFSAPQ